MDPVTIWYVLQIESFHINQNYSLILVVQSCCRGLCLPNCISMSVKCLFSLSQASSSVLYTGKSKKAPNEWKKKNSSFFHRPDSWDQSMKKWTNRTSQMEDFYCLNDFICETTFWRVLWCRSKVLRSAMSMSLERDFPDQLAPDMPMPCHSRPSLPFRSSSLVSFEQFEM